jgi:hypothetical protein
MRANAFAASAYNDAVNMFIYGGMNTTETVVNDAMRINFPTPTSTTRPAPRYRRVQPRAVRRGGAHLGNMAYFIGGSDTSGDGTGIQSLTIPNVARLERGGIRVRYVNNRVFAAAAGAPDQNVVNQRRRRRCNHPVPGCGRSRPRLRGRQLLGLQRSEV